MPAQALQRRRQLRPVLDLDDDGGWPEDFFLKQFIAREQQADISLEHLWLRLIALLRTARQMAQARMLVQFAKASAVAGQRTGVEHGLRRLLVHVGAECLKKSTELRRAHSDDQARIGAELPTTQRHRCGQLRSNLLTTHRERFGQQEHRVDARHLGKHRDRLRPGRGHVAQGIAALE
ncbi:hypothetical protein D3C72_1149210 [compost metagenome]